MSAPRHIRERRATVGWALFIAAVVAGLLAVWQWDEQWLATAGVLVVTAGAFGMGSWE